ncbi:hypothetical protein L1987_16348 [Smallanthus sonchifolius]|uniref:Uncharacterized protein n=1 Tax=Smallanthus sonchifolius TaxID=185202 RepID=A0ACB9J8N2_9ASTR|nr:hypothetical protein L1987_16348 [Smallanthus sonchifolius]
MYIYFLLQIEDGFLIVFEDQQVECWNFRIEFIILAILPKRWKIQLSILGIDPSEGTSMEDANWGRDGSL